MADTTQNATLTQSAQAAAKYIPIPVVNEVVSYLIGLVGIKGPTQHLNYEQTWPIAQKLGRLISDYLTALPINAVTISALKDQLADLASSAITSSTWWKVGNDQCSFISGDILKCKGLDFYEVVWRVLYWSFNNSPNDNFSDAYYSSSDIFNVSLYKILRANGYDVALPVIDGLIARTAKEGSSGTVSPAIIPKYGSLTGELTTSSSGFLSTLSEKVSDIVSSIFGSSDSSGGTQKASFSTPAIILITGAVVGIFYLWYKRLKT